MLSVEILAANDLRIKMEQDKDFKSKNFAKNIKTLSKKDLDKLTKLTQLKSGGALSQEDYDKQVNMMFKMHNIKMAFTSIIFLIVILLILKSCLFSDEDKKINNEADVKQITTQSTQVIPQEPIEPNINQPGHHFSVTLDDFIYSYNNLLNNYKKEFGKNVITSLKIDPKFMYEGGFGDVYTLVEAKSKVIDVNLTTVIDKNNKKLESLTFIFFDKSKTNNTKNATSVVSAVLFMNIINSLDIHGADADDLLNRLFTEYKNTNGRLITELTYNNMDFFFVIVSVAQGVHYELTIN